MKYENFFGDSGKERYHVSSYFYRIEFQQRGAPHVHSLLWMKDEEGEDAPSFWSQEENDILDIDQRELNLAEKKQKIEKFADFLISTSADDMRCKKHLTKSFERTLECEECTKLREKASKYQKHSHTFTCSKKGKTITIKSNEGHGKNDGLLKGPELRNLPLCRFNIPKFPMDKTRLILGISKDLDESIVSKRIKDLNKIKTGVELWDPNVSKV